MAVHARLKYEYTEDEKYHNLMRWLIYISPVLSSTVIITRGRGARHLAGRLFVYQSFVGFRFSALQKYISLDISSLFLMC